MEQAELEAVMKAIRQVAAELKVATTPTETQYLMAALTGYLQRLRNAGIDPRSLAPKP